MYRLMYFNHGFGTAWLGRFIPYLCYIVARGYIDRRAIAIAVMLLH